MTKKLLVVGFLILLYLGSMWLWINAPDGRKIELTAPCRVGLPASQITVTVRFKDLTVELPEKFQGKFKPGDSAWIGLTGTCHFEPQRDVTTSMQSDGYLEVDEVRFFDQGTDHTESLKVIR